ncbi:50S ribosomal protein L4 [Candidatus Microgenomates bacterium]|nr:50S ribosomal protein L4 [Candidatus Microgenomates bacterium]
MAVKKVTSNKKTASQAKRGEQVTKPTRKASGLPVPVFSLTGRAAGTMNLPKETFGAKVNKKLLAQAVRVYMANQKKFTASTKTRGEVRGSTAKVFRQKGTGRARHGAIRAPIFVGGGIVFGPKPRKVKLNLPKKMRRAALVSALSSKMNDKNVMGLSGLEKASGKTKEFSRLLKKVNSPKGALIVTGEKNDKVVRAVNNIPGVDVLPASLINAYEVVKHNMLLITKEAADVLSGKGKKV